MRCPPSVHGRCIRLALTLLASIASPSPLDGPGPSLTAAPRWTVVWDGRVGRGFELFCSWSRRYSSGQDLLKKKNKKKKQPVMARVGLW